MASVRAALAVVVLPPLSVLVVMAAARCLCRVMARKLSALARSLSLQFECLPSGSGEPSSFRYLLASSSSSSPSSVELEDIKQKGGGGGELPVALYSRRTTRRRCVGEEEQEQEEEEEEAECVLCLSGIEEGSEVRELRCRHLFHRACLDRWVRARPVAPTCPLCRGRLLAGYDDDEEEEEGGDDEAVVEEEEDSDMMLFMACVHGGRSSWAWLWPS